MCGSLKLSLERVQGICASDGLCVMLQCVLLLVEDVDRDDVTDNGLTTGCKDPEQELIIGSQTKVKVC